MIYGTRNTLIRFLAFVRPYWLTIGIVFILMILSTVGSLALPYITKIIIDDVIPGKDFYMLILVLSILVGIFLFELVISFCSNYLYAWLSNHIIVDMQQHLFQHLIHLPLSFYDQEKRGDIIYRLDSDIGSIQNFLSSSILRLAHSILNLIGLIVMLCWLDLKLFMLSIVVFPFFLANILYFKPKIRKLTEHRREEQSNLFSFLIERFNNIQLLQICNTYIHEQGLLRSLQNRLVRIDLKGTVYSSSMNSIEISVITLTMVFILGWGSYQIMLGVLTLGTLMAFIEYFSRLFSPIKNLNSLYIEAVQASVSMQRLNEILDLPTQDHTMTNCKTAKPFSFEDRILFNDIHFSFAGKPVFQGLNLSLEQGKKYALVGSSGSGKTTLAHLLCNFYTPEGGQIYLDGTRLGDIDIFELRKHIGLVIQQSHLFHETVWENIRYGNEDCTAEEVAAVANLLDLKEFVNRDNDLFHQPIGDQGTQLSGGQKQRISLTRTMLKNADILILDEATSALDSESEQEIFAHLRKLYADKTMIIISHRLGTIQEVDEIVCLAEGKVIEQGDHEALRKKRGHYWQLFRDQLEKLEKVAR